MEQIYHQLLHESIPQDLSKTSILLVGVLPETVALVTTRNPKQCNVLSFSYKTYTTLLALPAITSIFGDIALDETLLEKSTFDLIVFPMTKSTQHNLKILEVLQKHLTATGTIQVVGLNNGGIKGLASKLKKQGVAHTVVTNKRGGRVLALLATPQLTATEYKSVATPYNFRDTTLTVTTYPGLFSYKKSDKGTQLLLDNFPKCSTKTILDVGCGSGVLSIAASLAGARQVDALDISATAVLLAQENCKEFENITIEGGDMALNREDFYDIIITNPPFHDGIKTDLTTGERWLDSLLPLLHKGGVVWLVANSFISYGTMGRARFSSVDRIAEENGFVVYKMVK